MNVRALLAAWRRPLPPRWRRVALIVGWSAVILGLPYLACGNYLGYNEVGIARNYVTGALWLQESGFHLTAPWTEVARVDTRPQRVCVTTAGRGFNCKLAQFEPSHYREFVAVEGFYYYWWANRFSFNSGYVDEYRGMKDLLRGYAYSVKPYPFVTVLREYPAP